MRSQFAGPAEGLDDPVITPDPTIPTHTVLFNFMLLAKAGDIAMQRHGIEDALTFDTRVTDEGVVTLAMATPVDGVIEPGLEQLTQIDWTIATDHLSGDGTFVVETIEVCTDSKGVDTANKRQGRMSLDQIWSEISDTIRMMLPQEARTSYDTALVTPFSAQEKLMLGEDRARHFRLM